MFFLLFDIHGLADSMVELQSVGGDVYEEFLLREWDRQFWENIPVLIQWAGAAHLHASRKAWHCHISSLQGK